MGKKQDKKVMEMSTITNRTFNYTQNGVSLNFTLRTDIKQQLKDFKECMERAMKDVNEEISKK